jgi:hypothetical protein
MKLTTMLAPVLLACLLPVTASADVDSLITLGAGAQYGFVTDTVARDPEAPRRQYGLVARLKILRFVGIEAVGQLDENPHTQSLRVLSPRFQLGLMLNVIPTRWFNLYAVGGLGAHEGGDLFNLNGASTSLHAGPGLEVFLSEHVSLGFDVRFRVPGPNHIKSEVVDQLSTAPMDDAISMRVWQSNVMLGWYL